MSKLTKSERAKGPFAGPGKTYPIPDASHARAALSGASHAKNVGNISAGVKASIDAKARASLKRLSPKKAAASVAAGARGK